MTYIEKYQDLDRSQLPEKAVVIIESMKKDSKGFTDTEAMEVIGPRFDQVIAKLKSTGYDSAFKSLQKKEPEPKTPVAKAKAIVKAAIKQPTSTSKTATPKVGEFKKGAVGELAKKIRKDGERWPDALKRAGVMIKEQKTGVQKQATAQYKKLTSLLTKMPALRRGTDVERDAPRKAKPVGKRVSKEGNTYYEYRANRTDVRQGKGYPYLKLGAMLAAGGEIGQIYDRIQLFNEITEREINLIIKRLNAANGIKNVDGELKKVYDFIYNNEPTLSKEQNEKGIKYLRSIAFMANGKDRSNTPFGQRETDVLKEFGYMKLRGFHDTSSYRQPERYIPLFTVYYSDGEYGFEYHMEGGRVNVVGAKGMTVNKKVPFEVEFFDSDQKVKDFLNLSRIQFMARYKETKDRYQQMVTAITRNIEGVFMHGGKMSGAGQFANGDMMADGGMVTISSKIKTFYTNKYPKDNAGKEINQNATFNGLYQVLQNKQDVYHYIGVLDSLMRERIFDKLAQLRGVKYDEISSKMFSANNMAKGGMMADGGMSNKIVILVKDKKGNVVFRTTSTNKAADYVGLHGRNNFTVETLDGRRIMADGGFMAKGGLTNLAGTTTPKAYPMGKPNTDIIS